MKYENEAMNRDLWITQQVAKIQGYRDFRVSGLTGILYGTRDARPDDLDWQVDDDGTVSDPIPDYSRDIHAAWFLHLERPEGTILFNLAWLDMHPCEVARNICKAYIKWHVRSRIERAS
jgi:hypothetical protein